MSTGSVSLVLLGEARDQLSLEPRDPIVSVHSGKPLRQFGVTLRIVGEEDHDRLNAELTAADRGETLLTDTDGHCWKVNSHSYSYQAGTSTTVFTHTVELQEHEELSLARIEFEDLVLTPQRWSLEQKPAERIMREILTELDAEQHERLEQILEERRGTSAANLYFPVTWVGINDRPISMRFGRCLWEQAGNGRTRHLLVFVGEEGDDPSAIGLNQPEISRLQEQSVITSTKLNALITELRQAGVLDTEALERINNAAAHPSSSAMREFDRAHNLEEFFIGP